MKTSVRFIIAWALALIAFSSSVFAKSNIVLSVSSESPRRTAFQQGDGYRILSVYNFTNTGDTAGEVGSIGVKKKGLVAVIAEIGNFSSHSDFDGNASYAWMGIGNQMIAPGKTITIRLRGMFVYGVNEVSAEIDSFGGSFNNGELPGVLPASHALVDDLLTEGVSNTSIRTTVMQNQPTIFGFIVKGDENRGYPVLVRAVGPGLKRLGVPNAMTDPYIKLFNASGDVIMENDDYPNDLQGTFAAVGAFSLDRYDSAIMVWLVPGAYTVQVKGFGTGQGDVLIESYQLPHNYGAKG